MNTQKKTKGRSCTGSRVWRILLFVLLILLTLMQVLWCSSLLYAWKDMRHEGLTYSQWYEGSVDSFYFFMLIVIIHTQVFSAAWYVFIRKRLGKRSRPCHISLRGKRILPILFGVFAVLTAAAAYRFVHDKHLLAQVRAENVDPAVSYIRRVGVCRIYLTLAAEGFLLSGLSLIRIRRISQLK